MIAGQTTVATAPKTKTTPEIDIPGTTLCLESTDVSGSEISIGSTTSGSELSVGAGTSGSAIPVSSTTSGAAIPIGSTDSGTEYGSEVS